MLFLTCQFQKLNIIIPWPCLSNKIRAWEGVGAGVYGEAEDGTPWGSNPRGTIIFN